MRIERFAPVWLALMAIFAVGVDAEDDKGQKDDPKETVINIVGKDGNWKYLKEGDKDQADVTVTVGQTVTWKNQSDAPHTATSKMKVKDKRLFTTGTMAKNGSKSIKFDEMLFMNAGGVAGGEVKLSYFCTIHGEDVMKSSITLKSAEKKAK